MTARLGVHLQNFSPRPDDDWSRLVATAQAAERAGFHYVVVSDHVVFGERLDDYAEPALGGVVGGRQPTGPDGAWLEPLTLLAFVAARTERVRLVTHVLLAALRRPAVLAKSAATLDVLSDGRVDLGVGVGWQRAEYDACELEFDRRGELLDSTLRTITSLWAGTQSGVHQMPRPRQHGGVPLWISGRANAPVARRLAAFGSGWIPWGLDAGGLAAVLPELRRRVAEAGGDPNFRVVGRANEPAELPTVLAAGATDVTVRLDHGGDVAGQLAAWAAAFSAAQER